MINAHTIKRNETNGGTKYEIHKWTCPKCQQERSTLYIDDEWFHGDSQCTSWGPDRHPDGKHVMHTVCGHCTIAAMVDEIETTNA